MRSHQALKSACHEMEATLSSWQKKFSDASLLLLHRKSVKPVWIAGNLFRRILLVRLMKYHDSGLGPRFAGIRIEVKFAVPFTLDMPRRYHARPGVDWSGRTLGPRYSDDHQD